MTRPAKQRRDDALRIWRAAVEAVRSDRLVQDALRVHGQTLMVADELDIDLTRVSRIAVVGGGKAGAGMAAGFEAALGDELLQAKHVTGWLNVPADCVRPLKTIHLHAARPAGVNEPTEAGIAGSERILEIVSSLGPNDLCLCLISGGASALLPAPIEGITLQDKLAVTRFLSAAGANIEQLNTVRKQLSRIKGGGLLRACRAGQLITLIISDVIGDPLDVIGSGPTIPDRSTPHAALAVLEQFAARQSSQFPMAVFRILEQAPRQRDTDAQRQSQCFVIGNNALAVDAAGQEAVRLGYSPAMVAAKSLEGTAEEVGRHLADMALKMRTTAGPDCLISGGEPVVQLAPVETRGKGGRNQQLVLAALAAIEDQMAGITILSGGTDGEDGPTDAAGAWIDDEQAKNARRLGLLSTDFLRRNDAYRFFEPLGSLIKTGPTHTNVCDVRVVIVDRQELSEPHG
jgi:hydroxypyruvate reductase